MAQETISVFEFGEHSWKATEHPEWTLEEWRDDVFQGNTRLGYVEWVEHNLEQQEDEQNEID